MSEEAQTPKDELEMEGVRIVFPDPFLQRDLEGYQVHLNDLIGDINVLSVIRGAIVRTGIHLGWIKGLSEKEVGEKDPALIAWAATETDSFVRKAQIFPKA